MGRRLSRRDLLRYSAGLGLGAMASQITTLRLIQAAMAQTVVGDHKAIVNVFLSGGNDSNNWLIPADGDNRVHYDTRRALLAVPEASLLPITPGGLTDAYGLHPSCTGLQELFEDGDAAFVANLGTLTEPIASKTEYFAGSVSTPPKLFSHSDQQTQWQTAIPDSLQRSGWGGRMSELLHGAHNTAGAVSMSISLDGNNIYQVSTSGLVNPYAVKRTGTTTLNGYGTNYASALETDGSYKTTKEGHRLRALEALMTLSSDQLFEQAHGAVVLSGRAGESAVNAAIATAEASETTNGFSMDAVFTSFGVAAGDRLGDQLKQIARLIIGHDDLGQQRQIFFARIGGFDTHQAQLDTHGDLLGNVSQSLRAFQEVLILAGVDDRVVTFTSSEFSRTFNANSANEDVGSDHAWGGHSVVMGTPVTGRAIYGTFPSLDPDGVLDVDSTRGRFIPTTSVEQFAAPIASWFGVDQANLATVFPNLSRFDDPFDAGTNLMFLP